MKVIRVAFLLLLPGGLQGCKGGSGGTPLAVDTAAVRAEVDSAMRHHFAAFERGDLATWSALLDPAVFFTGADPADVFSHRDSVRAGIEADFGPAFGAGLTLSIKPVAAAIWTAPDGRTASAIYDLDYTATVGNRIIPYRLRAAYFLEHDSAGWTADAVQYSRPVSYDTLFMSLMLRRVPGAARVGGEVPSAAGEIVRQFRADIRDIGKVAFSPQTAVATPGSTLQGQAAKAELARWLGPPGNATEPGDGIRARLGAGSTTGWVATNLQVPVFAGPESAIAPLRALFIYRLGADRWELVQASLSVGLRDGS